MHYITIHHICDESEATSDHSEAKVMIPKQHRYDSEAPNDDSEATHIWFTWFYHDSMMMLNDVKWCWGDSGMCLGCVWDVFGMFGKSFWDGVSIIWDGFEMLLEFVLGRFGWASFGIVLGCCWDDFGMIWGWFGDDLGMIPGPFWHHLGWFYVGFIYVRLFLFRIVGYITARCLDKKFI